ncbi:MAG TPA: aminoacyl-tRNA hydrolase [Desulfarculaceae bacterium]|nr:aminoacyl-tRNA hydrolase [Desulfarculaceae bacterium]
MIVGLGNPGSEYVATRHNFGFIVLDYLLHKISSLSSFEFVGYAQAEIAVTKLADRSVLLVKPRTFMNRSGFAVRALMEQLQIIDLHRLLIVHDDLDLELGRIKLKQGGGSGGHNGLKSLIEELDSPDFLRLRLGIGNQNRTNWDTVDFVLAPFSISEQQLVDEVTSRSAAGIAEVVSSGITVAMNLINRRVSVEV